MKPIWSSLTAALCLTPALAAAEPGTDSDFGDLGDHAHYWGPTVHGELFEAGDGEIEFEVGYLFGLNESEADGQIRFGIEWEH